MGSLLPTILLISTIVPGTPGALSINGPLWTLVYEWWFYLLAMFAAMALFNKGTVLRFLPLIAVVVLFAASPAGTLLWVFLLIWLSGYALGLFYMRGWLGSPRMPALSFGIVAACLVAIVAIGRDRTLALVVEPLQRHGDAAHWTMLFIAIMLTTAIGFLIRKGVTTRAFNHVADYSYTLYLIHYPLLLLAFGLLHPVLHRYEWGVSLAIGCLMATLVLPVAAAIASVAENRELIRRNIGRFPQWLRRRPQSTTLASPPSVARPDPGPRHR